jgi:hypothetical protein
MNADAIHEVKNLRQGLQDLAAILQSRKRVGLGFGVGPFLDFLFRLLHPRRVTGFISLLASLLLERNCFSLGGGQILLRLLPGFREVVVAALVKILKVEQHLVPELAQGT